MTALVRNGDLVPDSAGMISKQDTFEAIVRTGVSVRVARITTNANFDHLPEPKIMNVFEMNTIRDPDGRNDPDGGAGNYGHGPLEHFRSTGIKDDGRAAGHPDGAMAAFKYEDFHKCKDFDHNGTSFSRRDIEECAA